MQFESHSGGSEQKLKELMLYIAQKASTDANFGAVVLNKALFFSDFLTFATTGQAITGVEYQKLRHGPAPRRLVPVRREMVENGEAAVAPADAMGYRQERLVALRNPDLSRFSGDEIATVDAVLDMLKGGTAKWASDLSHSWSVGWEVAALGETIPYATVFAAPPAPITPELEKEGRELAERYAAAE